MVLCLIETKLNEKESTVNTIRGELVNFIEHTESKTDISPTGKWTPVSCVTGGDTHHYTIEDMSAVHEHDIAKADCVIW